MRSEDFYELPNFTELEVGATGANYGDIQFALMKTLQEVRTGLNTAVHICDNGLTTGTHVSKYHHSGEAVDFYFKSPVRPDRVINAMLTAGFRGIGVYRNPHGYYSYHGDLRPHVATWYRETNIKGDTTDESIYRRSFFGV